MTPMTPLPWNTSPSDRKACIEALFAALRLDMTLDRADWEHSGYWLLLRESFDRLIDLAAREIERIYARALESAAQRYGERETEFRSKAEELFRCNLRSGFGSYARLYSSGQAEQLRIQINMEILKEMSRRGCEPVLLEQLSLEGFAPQLTETLLEQALPILRRRIEAFPYQEPPAPSRWYQRLPPLRSRLDGRRFGDHHIAVTGQLWQERGEAAQQLADELDTDALFLAYARAVSDALTREVTRVLGQLTTQSQRSVPLFRCCDPKEAEDA